MAPRRKKTKSPRKQQPARRKARRQPRRSMPSNVMSTVHSICALTDPFCTHAVGARIPDGAGGFSVPVSTRYMVTIQSDANGNAAALLTLGFPSAQYTTATVITAGGSVTTWGAAAADNYYGSYGVFESYRIVSAGWRWTTTASNFTAAGMMITGTVGNTFGVGSFACNALGSYLDAQTYPISGAKLSGVGRFSDQTESHNFQLLTYTSQVQPIIMPVFFGFMGMPATTNIGQIEIVVNYEFRPLSGQFSNLMSVRTPPANRALMDTAYDVLAKIPQSISDKTGEKVTTMITNYAMDAAINYLAPGPIRAAYNAFKNKGKSAPMIMDVD